MLCLQSWGCACISPWQRACCSPFPKGTSAVPVPAPGVQGPEAVAELLASVCTRFLHPQRDWKWLWWLKILKWSFSFSNPGHPERENCLQGSGVAGISLFPVCSGRRHFWVVFPCWWDNWACYSGGNKLRVLALPCTKARQSTGKEIWVKHLISHTVKPQN